MADEISQVVEMEFKGTYYLFKGTKAFIAYVGKLLTQLMEWQNERSRQLVRGLLPFWSFLRRCLRLRWLEKMQKEM